MLLALLLSKSGVLLGKYAASWWAVEYSTSGMECSLDTGLDEMAIKQGCLMTALALDAFVAFTLTAVNY
jgi:hypothetical protein